MSEKQTPLTGSNSSISRFFKWLMELPYSKCKSCGKKGLRFIYEDHFGTGKNVYECKFCKTQFV